MVRALHQRAVQGDQVTRCEQLIQLHISNEIKIRILIHVVCDDLHAKSMTNARHCRSDFSRSHDSGCLSVKIHSGQSLQAEIVLADSHICLVQMTVHCHRQSHRMLRYRLR